ncbi:MAG: protease inhibitor I9 family protein [Candidatus Kapaibacteriota bacterium]
MIRFFSFGLFLSFLLLFFGCIRQDNNPNPTDPTTNAPKHYIVLLKETTKDVETLSEKGREDYVIQFLANYNVKRNSVTYVYSSVVLGFAGYLSEQQIKQLKNAPEVLLVEEDKQIGIEPLDLKLPDKQEKPLAGTQTIPWGISAVGGYVLSNNNSRIGWVVDTGIDLYHPDLNVDVNLHENDNSLTLVLV